MYKKIFGVVIALCITFLFQVTSTALPIGPDKYFIDLTYGETVSETLYLYGRQEMTAPETLYHMIFETKLSGHSGKSLHTLE